MMASSIFKAQSLIRLEKCIKKHNRWNIVYTRPNIRNIRNFPSLRLLATCTPHFDKHAKNEDLSHKVEEPQHELTVGQKVKEAGITALSGGIVLLGVALTGSLVWYVAKELLLSFGLSSNVVFSKALDIMQENHELLYRIGTNMEAFGDEPSRGEGRRKHLNCVEYTQDGHNYMRVKFYVQGHKGRGTAYVEVVETSWGDFDFRYIIVELVRFPEEPIIVVDNRLTNINGTLMMASSIFKAQSLIRLERCIKKHNRWNIVYSRPNIPHIRNFPSLRLLATCTPNFDKHPENKDLSHKVEEPQHELTVGQKVKEAGTTALSGGIVLLGVALTGSLVWFVGNELLFGFSSNAVFSKALDIVKENHELQYEIGSSMKGFGEETGRGRRKHVSYVEYTHDGRNYMRVQFYVKGHKGQATVHVEAVETSRGNFDFRYIFVEFDRFPPKQPIIVLDNR